MIRTYLVRLLRDEDNSAGFFAQKNNRKKKKKNVETSRPVGRKGGGRGGLHHNPLPGAGTLLKIFGEQARPGGTLLVLSRVCVTYTCSIPPGSQSHRMGNTKPILLYLPTGPGGPVPSGREKERKHHEKGGPAWLAGWA